MKLNFLGIPVENYLEKQNIICVRTVLFLRGLVFSAILRLLCVSPPNSASLMCVSMSWKTLYKRK